jgi:hypothetical protein
MPSTGETQVTAETPAIARTGNSVHRQQQKTPAAAGMSSLIEASFLEAGTQAKSGMPTTSWMPETAGTPKAAEMQTHEGRQQQQSRQQQMEHHQQQTDFRC